MSKRVKLEDCLAYEGEQFTIEWFYDDKLESNAKEFYANLSQSQQGKLMQMFNVMGEKGQIRIKEKFRNEGDKIFAFKPKPDRFLSFFTKGKKLIVTNAFTKKQLLTS